MVNKRTILFGLALLCITAAYPHVRSMATESQAGNVQLNSGPIPFGHPEHAVFFKYQGYLTSHKKEGMSPERWNALPPQKQQELLAAGETMLKALHKELLAKPQLTAEETELLRAVWGKDENPAATDIPFSADAAAKDKPVNNEKVEAIFNSVENTKKVGNWGKFFDGGGSRSGEAVPITVAAPVDARSVTTNAKPSTANIKGNIQPPGLTSANTSSQEKNDGGTGGNTLPLAIGAVLLAGIYFGGKAFSGNGQSPTGTEADSDFASLKAATRQDARVTGTPNCGETCGCQTTYGPCGCTCTANCGSTCSCTKTCGNTCGDTCSCTRTCGCQTTYGPCDCTATCGCTATSCGSTCTCTGTCGCQTTYGPK